MSDGRRRITRTDVALADARLRAARDRLGPAPVKRAVAAAQDLARAGAIRPDAVVDAAAAELEAMTGSLQPVLNATGVVLHTNLGRAPLSPTARQAVAAAAGYVDVEYDLPTGRRRRRGYGALAALRERVPEAEAALVVNNGAAALLLAVTALAGGGEVVISRGELVEIGDGFRLPELIESTGVTIREVGTTNCVRLDDYAAAIGPRTGGVVKIHPSNFRVTGFTSVVPVRELAGLGVPVIADVGSGLLSRSALLPDEPDVASALRDGAGIVTGSADKLLGGPQAGLVLGRADLVERLRRHPMARALRVDKLTLAALEATLRGPAPPAEQFVRADPAGLRRRCEAVLAAVRTVVATAGVQPSDGAVGGGGAPGTVLPGWAVALPEAFAEKLRTGHPAVVARVERGRCLVDLRCVAPADDALLTAAIISAVRAPAVGGPAAPEAVPSGPGTGAAGPSSVTR